MKLNSLPAILILLFTAVLLAACRAGGGDLSPGGGAKPPGESSSSAYTDPDGADLSMVELDALTVPAFGRVRVTGIPAELTSEELYADYMVRDGDITTESINEARKLLLYTDDDTIYLLPPLLDADGAAIVLVISDGKSRSRSFELQVEALPAPREGATEEMLAAVNTLLKEATEALGKIYPDEWEHWRDTGSAQMPEYLLPLMQAWHAMLNPHNDQALINQHFDDEARVLLERILAAMPLLSALKGSAGFIESGDSLLSEAAASMMLRSSSVNRLSAPTMPMAVMANNLPLQQAAPQASSQRWEVEGLIDIKDGPSLAYQLDVYEGARWGRRNLELFDATVGTYLATIATVASLPLGPSGAATVTASRRTALAAVSNVASTLANANGVAMWFLPCCIVDLQTTLNPASGVISNEDAPRNQVKLTSARVTAESEGVDLTADVLKRLTKNLSKKAVKISMNRQLQRSTARQWPSSSTIMERRFTWNSG